MIEALTDRLLAQNLGSEEQLLGAQTWAWSGLTPAAVGSRASYLTSLCLIPHLHHEEDKA